MLLILSSNSFSQIDTNRICFSYNIAKLIAVDLVKGDSALAELSIAHRMICQLNERSIAQDSLIELYVVKEQNYIDQIDDYKKITFKTNEILTGLEGDVVKLNKKNQQLKNGVKWLSGGLVASILTIIILLPIP